jgi:hypothetical protein
MKASDLTQEIAALRKEVDALRQKQTKNEAKSRVKPQSKAAVKDEALFKQFLMDILSQLKKDYDTLSPMTALLLFSVGVMLGSVLAKSKGGRQ